MENFPSLSAPDLSCSGRKNYPSPCLGSRLALKWPDDFRGHPATVKLARLSLYELVINKTLVHLANVEADDHESLRILAKGFRSSRLPLSKAYRAHAMFQ